MQSVAFSSIAATMSYLQVRDAIVLLVGLVIAIAIHEFGHAAMAVWLGDDTPRQPQRLLGGQVDALGLVMGVNRGVDNRYTLNPLAHADPLGTILLPVAGLFLIPGGMLFGWGRPVPFNPSARRAKVRRKQMVLLVSLAGPASNLLQAIAYTGILVLAVVLGVTHSTHSLVAALAGWLQALVVLNMLLCAFNLLPIPPLDGGHLLTEWLERTHPDWARSLEQYGIFIFILLLPVLPWILRPVVAGSAGLTTWVVHAAGG
jgi:Zn-dependent protease